LKAQVDSTNKPSNAYVSIHTNASVSDANRLSNTVVTPSGTPTSYYVTYRDATGCYSVVSAVIVVVQAPYHWHQQVHWQVQVRFVQVLVVLSATCATGTLSWYTDSGLTGTALASSTVSPTTTTTYYGACVNGTCKSPASSVTVTVTATPLAPTSALASPSSICSGSSSVLSATCATGTLSWYTDSGLTGTALASSTVSPTTTTTYYGACVMVLVKAQRVVLL
jgi:hypothetical protein